MTDGTSDQLQVAFPATPTFTRIGRVAVVGLALRLGIDVSAVEQLRTAVDLAVGALQGGGRISTHASWNASALEIALSNPEALVAEPQALAEALVPLVDDVSIEPNRIVLSVPVG